MVNRQASIASVVGVTDAWHLGRPRTATLPPANG
jgi:hypothetical protein